MKITKVTYQDKQLLGSINFLTFGREETRIELEYLNEKIFFIIEFLLDDTKQMKHEFVTLDSQTLKLRLTNWENTLGMGFANPIDVGTIAGHGFYMIIWVKKAGTKSACHEVTLSAYIGDEVHNG